MSLVNIDSVRRQVLQMVAKLSPPEGVELLSYKRNRTVSVTCQGDDSFLVRERGYVEEEAEVSREELPRLLKVIIKREFPRSRKVRVYRYSDPDALHRQQKIL